MFTYKKGDRVKLSEEGYLTLHANPDRRGKPPAIPWRIRQGTIAATPRPGKTSVEILWDGNKDPNRYHINFIQPVEESIS